MIMDMPYDGRRHSGQPQQGFQPRPGLTTGYSNKHHDAFEFNYVYRPATPEKSKLNYIMTFIYILSLCFVVMIVIAAITLNPITPICHVNDVMVKNFTTKPTLTGDWYTNVTVYNPNKGRFGHFQDFIVYFMHNNDVIAGSSMPGFNVEKNKHEIVEVNASTKNENVIALIHPELKLEELGKERDNLFVVVDIKIVPVTVFMPKIGSYMEAKGVAFCPGMKIKFQKDTVTEGRLDKRDGQPNFCRIMIL
ncbi:hypothetical protein TanjilG_19635 [Lupinus angustifolius]|uniref:Late embryogenesis abundant protein LEA-2 subgroup domain-containing protein n=1 Tax=Lupinus angustifolius TaxID=3871 RepID=A0A1J7IEY3_LUPAN|nr:hypothetical protein TanjilG_19635 [Lupinus angustifolius]